MVAGSYFDGVKCMQYHSFFAFFTWSHAYIHTFIHIQRQIWYEKQRRRLQQYGAIRLEGKMTVWYNGRWCTVHEPRMTRNEIFGAYDHKEMEKLAGINGSRNKAAAKPILEGFEAYGAMHHAVYSFLYATQVLGSSCKPTSKVDSDEMFKVCFVLFCFSIFHYRYFCCRTQKPF